MKGLQTKKKNNLQPDRLYDYDLVRGVFQKVDRGI